MTDNDIDGVIKSCPVVNKGCYNFLELWEQQSQVICSFFCQKHMIVNHVYHVINRKCGHSIMVDFILLSLAD